MQDFTQLKVWQKAHRITLELYKLTSTFPNDERFGLTSQIRRCSGSIGANIAEGCGRDGARELNRFLQIASGSSSELRYHLLVAKDLGFVDVGVYQALDRDIIEVHKMISGLMAKVLRPGSSFS